MSSKERERNRDECQNVRRWGIGDKRQIGSERDVDVFQLESDRDEDDCQRTIESDMG